MDDDCIIGIDDHRLVGDHNENWTNKSRGLPPLFKIKKKFFGTDYTRYDPFRETFSKSLQTTRDDDMDDDCIALSA